MPTPFARGTLETLLDARVAAALACGALEPIATEDALIEELGVRFLVRAVSSLARKDAARVRRKAASSNPFLPWDPALFVADVSATHVALLNKFPVLHRHLLVVTRRFVRQEVLLDADDWAAIGRCLADIDGLAFYNGGEQAGASQPHKHMQLVPLPLAAQGPKLPVQPLLDRARIAPGGIGTIPGFEFLHACCRQTDLAAATLRAACAALMREVGIRGVPDAAHGPRQSGPYNLLLTREWMLLVPRTRERWNGVSVNALGFAGSLFVRDAGRLEAVRRAGPMTVLRQVAVPRA